VAGAGLAPVTLPEGAQELREPYYTGRTGPHRRGRHARWTFYELHQLVRTSHRLDTEVTHPSSLSPGPARASSTPTHLKQLIPSFVYDRDTQGHGSGDLLSGGAAPPLRPQAEGKSTWEGVYWDCPPSVQFLFFSRLIARSSGFVTGRRKKVLASAAGLRAR